MVTCHVDPQTRKTKQKIGKGKKKEFRMVICFVNEMKFCLNFPNEREIFQCLRLNDRDLERDIDYNFFVFFLVKMNNDEKRRRKNRMH